MNGFKPNAKMSSTCHYSHGGAVMKKAKGGVARGEGTNDEESGTLRMEKMPSGAQQYVRGFTRGDKGTTLSKYTRSEIDKLNPGSGNNDEWEKQYKKVKKLGEAQDDNFDAWDKDKEDGYKTGGKIMKKATGDAMNAKRIANPNMPRPMPGPRKPMVNGPLGPRNPNGPRKPMGSPSPMSGGIMAGMNSMLKGPMARKKGGMAKGMK